MGWWLVQKDGQSTNQLRWPARSGAGLLPAPKGLEERFRQWTRRSSPLNPAQNLFHLSQPFESGQDYDVLDWSQQHTGRDWVHHESQPGIDGESAVFFQESGTPSARRVASVPVRPAASEDPAVVVHKD